MIHQKIRSYLFILFLAIILAGCGNPFRLHYQNMLEKWPESKSLLTESQEGSVPKLITSQDMKKDIMTMLQNGYFLIGKVKFTSPPINEKQALDQAKEVGAEVVFVKRDYVTTRTESVPIAEWLPDKTITTTETSTYQKDPSVPPSTFKREITQTLEGELYTRYVPQSTDYYDYCATFWKKAKPLKFGVLVHALDEETKKLLQSNKGVVVKVVINKSPAFNADILRGDIITLFNNDPVADPGDFFEKIKTHAGQTITVKIIRDGKPKDITLTLLN
ncbi:PDZ domain-containing protein [bacterium]|nr:PDZ domain-containing protein [bacterium]MBU1635900.1 PDZ domain-containing protein [bacterium]